MQIIFIWAMIGLTFALSFSPTPALSLQNGFHFTAKHPTQCVYFILFAIWVPFCCCCRPSFKLVVFICSFGIILFWLDDSVDLVGTRLIFSPICLSDTWWTDCFALIKLIQRNVLSERKQKMVPHKMNGTKYHVISHFHNNILAIHTYCYCLASTPSTIVAVIVIIIISKTVIRV